MEKAKLIDEKMAQVARIIEEIQELQNVDPTKDFTANAVIIVVQDDPNDNDGKVMHCATLGNPRDVVNTISRVSEASPELKNMLEDGLRLSDLRKSPLYDIFQALEGDDRGERCDCPACTEERAAAIKNNPNIN